jgi:hypothetical protein
MQVGLGWHILTSNQRKVVWHNGGTGGYHSFAGFAAAAQVGVVVLTNSSKSVDDIGFHLLDPDMPLGEVLVPVKVEPAPGERLPTGEEIVERSIESVGGRQALTRIRNRFIQGTMEIRPVGIKGSIRAYQARPSKYYARIELEGIGAIERGTDGEVVWELNPMTGPRVIEGEEKATMLLLYAFDDADYRERYEKIECVGMEEVEGEVCYKVVFTPKKAKSLTAYFSKASGLGIKTELILPHPFGPMKIEIFTSDFKKVDDILYAHCAVEKAMGTDTRVTITGVKHNLEMPEDRFELPSDIKELVVRRERE